MKTYNCVVCIKQVPDTGKVTGDAMKADGTINRAALPAIFNPEDRNALEAALWVKETYGGTVTFYETVSFEFTGTSLEVISSTKSSCVSLVNFFSSFPEQNNRITRSVNRRNRKA